MRLALLALLLVGCALPSQDAAFAAFQAFTMGCRPETYVYQISPTDDGRVMVIMCRLTVSEKPQEGVTPA